MQIEDQIIVFHKVPGAAVVVQERSVYSVLDVYARGEELYARKGQGYIKLMKSKQTGRKGLVVDEFILPFQPRYCSLGRLQLPKGYKWPADK